MKQRKKQHKTIQTFLDQTKSICLEMKPEFSNFEGSVRS